jgi:Flp pilus assembly protein TadG
MRDRSRSIGRFVRGDEGATAVEFALVIGPLLLILGAIIEIGLMLFTEYTLQDGVQEAGRLIRTSTPTTSAPVRAEICKLAPTMRDCTTRVGTSVQTAGSYSTLTAPTLTAVSAGADIYAVAPPNSAVILMATYDWNFIFPGMNVLSNVEAGGSFRRLQGIAVFQVEPP